MPKVRIRQPADSRTRVDRLLDRVKNNRVAAIVIVACLGIGAVASLTDSARKLGEMLPAFGAKATAAGEWKSAEVDLHPNFYGNYGPEFMRLSLQETAGDQLTGFVQFGGNERKDPRSFPIVEGKRVGKAVSLSFYSGNRTNDTLAGDVAGDDLHLVYHEENGPAIPVTAHRLAQSAQLVDGRLAIVFKGTEFAEPRSACIALLNKLDPPQRYKLSEAPDESGNVHCVGTQADGSEGFDQFQNDVQNQVVCPARSRIALVPGKSQVHPQPVKACECDADLVAAGAKCAARS